MTKNSSMVPRRISRFEYSELQQVTPRSKTKEERRVIWNRLAKRFMKVQGYIKNKMPLQWDWVLGYRTGTVEAFTRSQARAQIKQQLGLASSARLPKEVTITKKEVNNDLPTSD
jgi:hypothetical protein